LVLRVGVEPDRGAAPELLLQALDLDPHLHPLLVDHGVGFWRPPELETSAAVNLACSTTTASSGSLPTSGWWGSVLGVQPDGYQIFSPSRRAYRLPPWAVDRVLWPWLVRWGIYRGVRPAP
jgi:hypothetical protein